jgi:hypothetical protein
MRFLGNDSHPASKGLPRKRADVPIVEENAAAYRLSRSG